MFSDKMCFIHFNDHEEKLSGNFRSAKRLIENKLVIYSQVTYSTKPLRELFSLHTKFLHYKHQYAFYVVSLTKSLSSIQPWTPWVLQV